jgi:hypothetical protein
MFKQLITSNNQVMDWKFDWEQKSIGSQELEDEKDDE